MVEGDFLRRVLPGAGAEEATTAADPDFISQSPPRREQSEKSDDGELKHARLNTGTQDQVSGSESAEEEWGVTSHRARYTRSVIALCEETFSILVMHNGRSREIFLSA